jgi:arginyl-tRNA synthetase
MVVLTRALISERNSGLTNEELAAAAEAMAIASITFHLLRYAPQTKILFKDKQSLIEGKDTAQFCMFAYARACGLVEKSGISLTDPYAGPFKRLGNAAERACALEVLFFPNSVLAAAEGLAPSILIDRMLSLCRAFDRFDTHNPIVSEDGELTRERLALTAAVARALRIGFSLLGINAPERL